MHPPLRSATRTLLALVAAAAAVGAEQPRLELEPCRLPGLDEEVRCGTLEVYENRAAASGRKIPLRVVVLPARDEQPEPDPIFYFAGGPGGSAVESAGGLSFLYRDLRQRRDLVLIDVRGTGESNPLHCPYQTEDRAQGVEEVLETFMPTELLPECRAELSKKADLRLYTTPMVVDDVEEVRAALGYQKINLMGGSYGTRPVQVYMRRHPQVVRSAVVAGVVPMDARSPLSFARDAQAALDALFEECAADPDCHRAFPDPAADLARVLARLDQQPVEVEVVDTEGGGKRELVISRNVMVQTLRYMLYNALYALQVPAYLRAAAEGDFGPLGQTAFSVAGALMISIPDGMYLSVTCTEDVAFIDPAEIAAATAGTFLGDFRVRAQRDACAEWVRGELPEGFTEAVRSDVPVLIVTGERDPVTPVRWGEEVASTLPRSYHLVIPDGAHGSFGLEGLECADKAVTEFVERGGAEGVDFEACRAAIRRPPFLLQIAADEPIELAPEELSRFAGVYAEAGLALTVEVHEGGLRASSGEEKSRLIPVAPTRFAVEGAPPGSYFVFELEGDAVVAVEFVRGGRTLIRAPRVK